MESIRLASSINGLGAFRKQHNFYVALKADGRCPSPLADGAAPPEIIVAGGGVAGDFSSIASTAEYRMRFNFALRIS